MIIFSRSIRLSFIVPLTAALLCAPVISQTALAQSRPPARAANDTLAYVYVRGADTVAIERIVVRPEGVRGELASKSQGRIVWHQQIIANTPNAFDLDVYAPTAGPGAVPVQSATLRVEGETGFVDVNANGATNNVQRVPVPANSAWMLNSSVLHTDVLATLALKRNMDTLNVVLAQGGNVLKMAIRKAGDTTIVVLAGTESRFIHDATGLVEANAGPGAMVRRVSATDMSKLAAPKNPEKVSYDAPAGAPYTAENVVINTESGFQLAGTLTRPRGTAKVPLVITISGSGEQERDSRLAPVPGYAIFRDIADTLGRRGIAVLRVDDRGVGASTGRETRAVATSADYANDVKEVIKYARTRKDIDANKIVLLGHSEGGMIAPMVASQDKQLRAIVLLAGTAYTGRRVMTFQNQDAINQVKALTPTQRDSIMRTVPAALDSLGRVNPWIGFFLQHDPLRTAKLVTQPVLIVQGETDHQVTPEQADTLAIAMRGAGNKDVTVKKFPDTDHLFLADPSGVASGYATLPDKHVRRTVLGTVADWLVLKLK